MPASPAVIALAVLLALFIVGTATFLGLWVSKKCSSQGPSSTPPTCEACSSLSCADCPTLGGCGATCGCADLPKDVQCNCPAPPAPKTCGCTDLPAGTKCNCPTPSCKTNPAAKVLTSNSSVYDPGTWTIYGDASSVGTAYLCPAGKLFWADSKAKKMYCSAPNICTQTSQASCTTGSLQTGMCRWTDCTTGCH